MICVVLAKAPIPGRVKTRLCPPATAVEAARLAAAALVDTLAVVRSCAFLRPVVAMAGSLDQAEYADEIRSVLAGIPVIGQRGRTLGERIAAAHADASTLFAGLPSLQIGMDTPHLTVTDLEKSAGLLENADAMLGMATDGGWWILGLRRPANAQAIASVPTSRSDTGEQTLKTLRRHLKVAIGPVLSDVDTMADAYASAALAPDGRFAAELASVLVTDS
ncbi:TIGR04282 family arsenosugar biosynthesis glycosyltransferase [Fodinicola feengrottensis]|uniref:DUF2064 domain-containing protein n=1 Tax=Fodinicola feengrottensis TaxID=435914 RepID=A0ABN2H0S1_9ACTN|nr:DUF2064 domain-containing protein [Fodinicola feengrottensis]